MDSIAQEPLLFFDNLLSQFDDYVEINFYSVYESQLVLVYIDREAKTISYTEQSGVDGPTSHIDTLEDFLRQRCKLQKNRSIYLIEKTVNNLIYENADYLAYLKLVESKLIQLHKLSVTFSKFDISTYITAIIKDFTVKYNSLYKISREFLLLSRNSTLQSSKKSTKQIVFSYEWMQTDEKLFILYNSLVLANPPFIESSFETFKKAFTKQYLDPNEGIRWLCMGVKNKNQYSKVTLIKFIDLLFDKGLINYRDKMDSDKIIKNVFLDTSGNQIINIKGSKNEKSKNPSRFNEIESIVDILTST